MAELSEHLKYDSIQDVISILDTAFLKGDELVPQYRAMQIANRALIAHHAIEKGLKARLEKAKLTYPKSAQQGHDLNHLYGLTKQICNGKWADDLASSYKDAVSFYEYDVEMLPHLETLEAYLMKVGSGEAFKQMRYWLEDYSAADSSVDLMSHISLHLHREILEALWSLVAFDQQRFVSQRVEQSVKMEIQRILGYSPRTPSEQSFNLLIQWLQTQPNFRTALREAVQQNYQVKGIDELGRQNLRKAFESLNTSDTQTLYPSPAPSADPAVSFYIVTCRDIRHDSQLRYPDAEVRVEWKNEQRTWAWVFSPAGELLGRISKHPQSRWQVVSGNSGAFSKSFEGAKHWMITKHCKQVSVITDEQARQAYIVSTNPYLPDPNTIADPMDMDSEGEFELNFWDEKHNLQPGQRVAITIRFDEESEVGERLEGSISRVEQGKVWTIGSKLLALIK